MNHDNLKIYKTALDLVVYFEKIVFNFDKYHKYAIGIDLKNKARQISLKVIRANTSKSKSIEIQEMLILIEELKFLIRLCKEINGFKNKNSYSYSSKLLTTLENQAITWKLYSQKREQTEENPEL
jgi:MoaA/NifB/PqqE/SkfB family radical SAM enzyme